MSSNTLTRVAVADAHTTVGGDVDDAAFLGRIYGRLRDSPETHVTKTAVSKRKQDPAHGEDSKILEGGTYRPHKNPSKLRNQARRNLERKEKRAGNDIIVDFSHYLNGSFLITPVPYAGKIAETVLQRLLGMIPTSYPDTEDIRNQVLDAIITKGQNNAIDVLLIFILALYAKFTPVMVQDLLSYDRVKQTAGFMAFADQYDRDTAFMAINDVVSTNGETVRCIGEDKRSQTQFYYALPDKISERAGFDKKPTPKPTEDGPAPGPAAQAACTVKQVRAVPKRPPPLTLPTAPVISPATATPTVVKTKGAAVGPLNLPRDHGRAVATAHLPNTGLATPHATVCPIPPRPPMKMTGYSYGGPAKCTFVPKCPIGYTAATLDMPNTGFVCARASLPPMHGPTVREGYIDPNHEGKEITRDIWDDLVVDEALNSNGVLGKLVTLAMQPIGWLFAKGGRAERDVLGQLAAGSRNPMARRPKTSLETTVHAYLVPEAASNDLDVRGTLREFNGRTALADNAGKLIHYWSPWKDFTQKKFYFLPKRSWPILSWSVKLLLVALFTYKTFRIDRKPEYAKVKWSNLFYRKPLVEHYPAQSTLHISKRWAAAAVGTACQLFYNVVTTPIMWKPTMIQSQFNGIQVPTTVHYRFSYRGIIRGALYNWRKAIKLPQVPKMVDISQLPGKAASAFAIATSGLKRRVGTKSFVDMVLTPAIYGLITTSVATELTPAQSHLAPLLMALAHENLIDEIGTGTATGLISGNGKSPTQSGPIQKKPTLISWMKWAMSPLSNRWVWQPACLIGLTLVSHHYLGKGTLFDYKLRSVCASTLRIAGQFIPVSHRAPLGSPLNVRVTCTLRSLKDTLLLNRRLLGKYFRASLIKWSQSSENYT